MSEDRKQLTEIIEKLSDNEVTFVLRFLKRVLGIS